MIKNIRLKCIYFKNETNYSIRFDEIYFLKLD